jgi:zinc protease
MRFARTVLAAAVIVIGFAGAANAVDVQRVVSPHGIEAWLVEDQSIPLIAMSFAFVGGATQDPVDKPGVANMLSGLLDEGAGDLDSEAFQTRLDDLSIELSFDASHDTFSGSLKTLAENRDEAARLLHLSLTAPRFDQEPVERIRAQVMTGIRARERNPGEIASNALMKAIFPDHPYGRPVEGTQASVAAITVDDLNAFRHRVFARDNLKVAVVGAIDAATLGAMLDEVFADLPAAADLAPIAEAAPPKSARIDVPLAIPQTLIRFAGPGLKRNDPDYIPAAVATYILGGGGDGSRLFDEVRDQRGLAYAISLSLDPLDHAGLVVGGTSTRADQADAVLALVESEIGRFAEEGPTADELAQAKDYLIGSYPLGFTTSTRIARRLLGIELDGLGIDYIDRRSDLIAALTVDQVRAAARRLFGGGDLVVVRVGQPAS